MNWDYAEKSLRVHLIFHAVPRKDDSGRVQARCLFHVNVGRRLLPDLSSKGMWHRLDTTGNINLLSLLQKSS